MKYSIQKISRMITHQREKYNWDFLFLSANQDAIQKCRKGWQSSKRGAPVQRQRCRS